MTTKISKPLALAFCIALTVTFSVARASIEAVTSDGRHVILDDNGTWKVKIEKVAKPGQLDDIAVVRNTPKSATSVARSGFPAFSFAYDPKKWTVEQHPISETVEFTFRHVNGSAVVKVVDERVQMTLEGLKKLNLSVMQKTDPKAHIDSEATMTVNGNEGLVIDSEHDAYGGRWHGRRFMWTGKEGSVQIICSDAANLYAESSADINDLIAGFSVTNVAKTP